MTLTNQGHKVAVCEQTETRDMMDSRLKDQMKVKLDAQKIERDAKKAKIEEEKEERKKQREAEKSAREALKIEKKQDKEAE